ncbi:hypothetical protein [Candidatus Kryptobacter tengchongensis]|uniref:Uncharacterized protein n=1 Tax=Kryptobacter tengchongensis TaxID=1643429 RepID=A0A656D3Z4_KRYT1|nr:hypothetical protein [Candidatus Kryptobacter tengchongensis]CUS96695.1 hypothetical protein JGI24_00152 [Candidatus Kryptobacter tengchongensis]
MRAFILTLVLFYLASLQNLKTQNAHSLEVGFRVNLPYIAMNYEIAELKSYDKKDMKLLAKVFKSYQDVIGLHPTLSVNFMRDLNFECKFGIVMTNLDPTGFVLKTSGGFTLRKFTRDRKFYGAISAELGNYDLGQSVYHPAEWSMKLIGAGFGVRIWKSLYYEVLFHFPLGDNLISTKTEPDFEFGGKPPIEYREERLISFIP